MIKDNKVNGWVISERIPEVANAFLLPVISVCLQKDAAGYRQHSFRFTNSIQSPETFSLLVWPFLSRPMNWIKHQLKQMSELAAFMEKRKVIGAPNRIISGRNRSRLIGMYRFFRFEFWNQVYIFKWRLDTKIKPSEHSG